MECGVGWDVGWGGVGWDVGGGECDWTCLCTKLAAIGSNVCSYQ